jgi:hypothetical protein
MSTERSRRAWDGLRAHLKENNEDVIVTIPRRRGFPHPRDAGARLTSTWPVGQTADYLIDGKPPLAVREFPDRFEASLDTARVAVQVLEAVERDPSKAMYIGAAMLGGAIGSSVSNKREGVLLGAGLGLLFAALLDGTLDEGAAARRRSGT